MAEAETVANNAHLGHEDDINFLEIEFDETAGAVAPSDRSSAGMPHDDGTAPDDFDIQIDEFEAADDAGNHVDNGSIPSAEFTSADLGIPQETTAGSEIGYDDEEQPSAEATSHDSEAPDQDQGNSEIAGVVATIDEIDYEDGEFAATQDDNITNEPQPALTASERQEVVADRVLSQQVLDETLEQDEYAQGHEEEAAGSAHELSEVDQDLIDDDHLLGIQYPEQDEYSQGHEEEADGSAHELPEVDRDLTDDDQLLGIQYPHTTTSAPAREVSDVMVLYNGVKYELCASVRNMDPETYFFAGNVEMDAPLSQFFGLLRDVIKDEIEPSDDLVIRVPQLKLEFGEVRLAAGVNFRQELSTDLSQDTSNEFLEKHTFRNILDLYRRFKYNDGEDAEHAQLVVHLAAKPNCQERFAMLVEAADAGRGWSEFFDNSDGSESFSGHHSVGDLDEEQVAPGSGEDQTGGTADDMQPETVEIVEEAYFYDDTNDAGDHDGMFDDRDAGNPEYHGDNVDDLDQGDELAGELVDNIEFGQVPDRFDDNMGDDDDDASQHTYPDHDRNSSIPHADADNEDFSSAASTVPGGTGKSPGDRQREGSNEDARSPQEPSDTFASGNYPFSFRPLPNPVSPTRQEPTNVSGSDEDLIDYSDDEDTSDAPAVQYRRRFSPPPHFPRRYGKSILDVPTLSSRDYVRPRSEDDADDEPDDDLIDSEKDDVQDPSFGIGDSILPSIEKDDDDVFTGGENGNITLPSFAWSEKSEAARTPSASSARDSPSPMKSSNATHRPVRKYHGAGKFKHSEAGHETRSSISCGQTALMMEPMGAAPSAVTSSSHRLPWAHSAFALDRISDGLQDTGANLLDAQVHDESAIQPDAGIETAQDHDLAPPSNLEDRDNDNLAAADNSIDIEGFTAYDEAADSEPLPLESHNRVTGSHDTSATSTVNGDEITYEDENSEDGTPHAGDDTAANVDEIDWENDGAEDTAVAEDPTNLSSPSGLSVKRGREADDLINLDDENGMWPQVERERRCIILMQSTDAKRRKI